METPASWFAVKRYSGTWSRSRCHHNESELLEWAREQRLKPEGEPVFAR